MTETGEPQDQGLAVVLVFGIQPVKAVMESLLLEVPGQEQKGVRCRFEREQLLSSGKIQSEFVQPHFVWLQSQL